VLKSLLLENLVETQHEENITSDTSVETQREELKMSGKMSLLLAKRQ
jgi:hypothetical protein